MNKNTALYVMLIGAGASLYDILTTEKGATAGKLYGPEKPLADLRWNFYTKPATTTAPIEPAKNYYISVTDAMALVGAYFYFR
jgi:hypothetical protein